MFPEVITALGHHLGVVTAEKAWRAAYRDLGILSPGDFSSDDPVIIGLYVGALMSHAVIVARELAIPCVVAVESATELIPDGAMVEVDGTAGTVTLL